VLYRASRKLLQSQLEERPTIMSMCIRIAAVAFAFAMILAPVGCSKTAPNAGQSTKPAASSSTASAAATTSSNSSNSSLQGRWTADAITQAFTTINQKIGANPADYVDVTIDNYRVAIKAINPQKRQNVDEYDYDGTAVKVTPVDISNNQPGAIEESAFKSDTVKPEVLTNVMASALKDSGLDDVTMNTVIVEKIFANDPAPVIQVAVSGPRAHKVVRYDVNGQFKQVV
jgi:hypothetical protein